MEVCHVCSSRQIILDAGFYFCQECGAQQEGRRETEHDNAFGQRMSKPKKRLQEETEQRERIRTLRADPHLCERALLTEDYPRWLDSIGARLCTSAKLMAKMAHTMVHQFRVPQKCVDHAQFLFYTYLNKAGVAFCAEETTEEEDKAFCPLVKCTLEELKKLRTKKKIVERERVLQLKREILDRSSIWEQISFQQDDDVKRRMVDDEEEEVDVLQRVKTSLSIEAVNRASVFYLGIDLLLCIVYLATQMCGCKWIQLSDIFRWYREGRFDISYSQLCALNLSTSWTMEHLQEPAKGAERRFFQRQKMMSAYLGIQPTSESYRIMAFLTQFIGIPRSIETMDFRKVLARLVYNLNLPRAFLTHLFTITELLPPVNVDLGAEYFYQTQPIDTGLRDRLRFVSLNRAHIGFVSFFQRAFLPNHSQLAWQKIENQGQFRRYRGSTWHFVPLPVEVKAAALVLFGLKLFFGLDGQREFRMQPKKGRNAEGEDEMEQGEGEEDDCFNFAQWLVQLELRTHCWQGTPAKVALGKDFQAAQMDRSNPEIANIRPVKLEKKVMERGQRLFRHYRRLPFAGCVPNTLFNSAQSQLFGELFEQQFQSPRTSRETATNQNETQNTKEALFTPLQYQAIVNREILAGSTKKAGLNKQSVQAFFKPFYDTKLELKLPADGENQPIDRENMSGAGQQIADLFPCSSHYKRYPAPELKCFAMVVPEFDERGFLHEYHHNRIRIDPLPIAPILHHKQMKMALHISECLLAPSFRALLRHLALAIGETDHLVYFAFLMVEAIVFDRTCFQRIQRDLRQHGHTIFSSQMTKAGVPLRVRYTLNLDLENGGDDEEIRQRAKMQTFRYKLSRTRLRNADDMDEDGLKPENIIFHEPNPAMAAAAEPPPECGPFMFIQAQKQQENAAEKEVEEAESDSNEEDGDTISLSSSCSGSSSTSMGEDEASKMKRPIRLVSLPAPATLALCAFRHW